MVEEQEDQTTPHAMMEEGSNQSAKVLPATPVIKPSSKQQDKREMTIEEDYKLDNLPRIKSLTRLDNIVAANQKRALSTLTKHQEGSSSERKLNTIQLPSVQNEKF